MFDVAARKAIQIALPFIAALVVMSASRLSAQAQANHMLVIPASDGYDFDDCLSGAKACGKTIADAWCEAHGMSASLAFGKADDITASLAKTESAKAESVKVEPTKTSGAAAGQPLPKFAPGSYLVNCRD